MLKLAIDGTPLAPGGGLMVLVGLLEAWREMAAPLEITLFASRPAVLDAVRAARPDIKVVPFGVRQSAARRYLLKQLKLGRQMVASRADSAYAVQLFVRGCPVPQLVHHQNLLRFLLPTLGHSLLRGPAFFARDCEARHALKRAAANVFISKYLQKQAERVVPESAPRNVTIYNGLPTAWVAEAASVGQRWDGGPHLVTITSAGWHKDNPTLIRTLAALRRKRPEIGWRLAVAGGGNFGRARKLAEELGVADRITWLGFIEAERIGELLRQSVCMIFTSVVEAFGMPVIEAMARSCPVVASNCTALPEVIGDAGLLAEPGNAEQFADAVIRIYEDRQMRSELIRRGLERLPQFSWTDSAEKMLAVLERIAR